MRFLNPARRLVMLPVDIAKHALSVYGTDRIRYDFDTVQISFYGLRIEPGSYGASKLAALINAQSTTHTAVVDEGGYLIAAARTTLTA